MGLWKRLEEKIWTGKVVKDYGLVAEGRYGRVKRTVSAMLTERSDGRRFVIRFGYKGFLAASVHFVDLDRHAAIKLKAALDEAVQKMVQ